MNKVKQAIRFSGLQSNLNDLFSGLLTSKCSPSSWWLAAAAADDAEEDPKADPDENEVSW